MQIAMVAPTREESLQDLASLIRHDHQTRKGGGGVTKGPPANLII